MIRTRAYGFEDQITRSGLSIPATSPRTVGRLATAGSQPAIHNAKGSSGELRTRIYIGIEAGYIDREQGMKWIQETREISRMLYTLMKNWSNAGKS